MMYTSRLLFRVVAMFRSVRLNEVWAKSCSGTSVREQERSQNGPWNGPWNGSCNGSCEHKTAKPLNTFRETHVVTRAVDDLSRNEERTVFAVYFFCKTLLVGR